MSTIGMEDYVAVEDCLQNCPNHFSLAYHAANRAHLILRRGDAQVPEGEDRVVVVALREIAGGHTAVPPMKIDIGGDIEPEVIPQEMQEGEESLSDTAEVLADGAEVKTDAAEIKTDDVKVKAVAKTKAE